MIESDNYDTPISGATTELYKCVSGSGVSQGTDTTDGNGYYEFADLDPEEWYYVEAQITGPLTGMSPAPGTKNPSNVVGLGPNTTINFEFED